MTETGEPRFRPQWLLAWAGLVVLWTLATWLLEGRIHTLLRPDAVRDRLLYVVVANLLIGVGGSALFVRRARGACLDLHQPPRPLARFVAVAVGLGLGAALLWFRGLRDTHSWVFINAYAQVLTVSVAELAVCWWALDAALRAARPPGRSSARLLLLLLGAPAFGLYHLGHSPPFDSGSMITFLTAFGLATGLFYVLARDLYGPLLFHNFAGTLGVVTALAEADRLVAYDEPRPATLALGLVGLGLLLALDFGLASRKAGAKRPLSGRLDPRARRARDRQEPSGDQGELAPPDAPPS